MSLGTDHQENARLIQSAKAAGINYFDTADIYQNGFNEESVGRAIKPFRQEVFLATKVGNQPKVDGKGWVWNPSKSYILKAVDQSLKRLKTDYIDLYQLHGGTIDDPWEETISAFEILKEQGKILHYGISSIRPNVIKRFAHQIGVVSNMLQYSLLDRRPEEEVLNVLQSNNIGVLVRGALAKGLLVNKALSNYLDYNIQDIDLMRDKLNSFSIEKNMNAQLVIQWVLKSEAVSSVVIGIRNMEQLESALSVYEAPEMSDTLYNQLSEILPVNFYTSHRE